MKTTRLKAGQIFALLLALAALLGVTTKVQATSYTANTVTMNWSTTTAWTPTAPSGGPAAGDSVSIPSGKTVTIDGSSGTSLCTSAGQSISVGGSLQYSHSGVTLGDITISNGATLNSTINATGFTFAGMSPIMARCLTLAAQTALSLPTPT